MKKNPKITLESLAKQITEGFKAVNHQLVQLTGETAYNRNETNSLRSEMRSEIGGLRSEMNQRFQNVDKRFDEINKRFDANDDTHQDILGAIDEMTDAKLARHCKTYHSVIT